MSALLSPLSYGRVTPPYTLLVSTHQCNYGATRELRKIGGFAPHATITPVGIEPTRLSRQPVLNRSRLPNSATGLLIKEVATSIAGRLVRVAGASTLPFCLLPLDPLELQPADIHQDFCPAPLGPFL